MRYAVAQQTPPQGTTEGDSHFTGMNSTVDRDKLDSGYYALAINKRCRRGVAETRAGTMTPVFANPTGVGVILGSGLFSNPNGTEVILEARATGVFQMRAGVLPQAVPVLGPEVAGVRAPAVLIGPVEFSQHFAAVLLHDLGETYVWDGIASEGFMPMEKLDPEDTSTVLVPPAAWSFDLAGRSYFPVSRDEIGISDTLDYTSYDATLRKYRVNAGTSDQLVGAYPYAQGSVVVGKARSFDILTGLSTLGATTEAVAMEVLTTSRGLLARRSWKMVGGDGYFLSDDRHIYRLGAVVTDRLEASPVPVSANIEPLIQRINGQYASASVAAVFGEYYYLAVPLDDSTVNNAVLVFNTNTKQFEGYDAWAGDGLMQIDNFIVANYLGSGRLFAVNHAGTGSVHLMYEGQEDQIGTTIFQIRDVLETRGFSTLGWNAASRRDFQRLEIAVETWHPSVSVTAIMDGARDERALTSTPVTKNPAKYTVFGIPDYDPTNVNDDFDVPGREDYSVNLEAGIYLGTEGIELGLKQSVPVLRFALKARGRFISLRIENTQGQCDVGGVLLASTGTQREARRAG